MEQKVTIGIWGEFKKEVWDIWWSDNGPSAFLCNFITTQIPTGISLIFNLVEGKTTMQSLLDGWHWIALGLAGGIIITMWRAHGNIIERYRHMLAEMEQKARAGDGFDEAAYLEERIKKQRVDRMFEKEQRSPLQEFKNYIAGKIYEANMISNATTADNLKDKAEKIWKWEEGLLKGIKSSLGDNEAYILLGADKMTLKRKANWADTEGQWILYRSGHAHGVSAVKDFQDEVASINAYLVGLSERTLARNLISTFHPADLRDF